MEQQKPTPYPKARIYVLSLLILSLMLFVIFIVEILVSQKADVHWMSALIFWILPLGLCLLSWFIAKQQIWIRLMVGLVAGFILLLGAFLIGGIIF